MLLLASQGNCTLNLGEPMKKVLGTLLLTTLSVFAYAEQTGDCTAGEQYCEQNSLETSRFLRWNELKKASK